LFSWSALVGQSLTIIIRSYLLNSLPVLEAPRTDASTARPRHSGVKEATKNQTEKEVAKV